MTRTVTGIKPTGSPHLGNYYGVIQPALHLADSHETFYFVADYHALTAPPGPVRMRTLSADVAAHWIALGYDHERHVLYRQSDVPEVCELAWLLACCTAKGLLNRAHAYKAAVQANDFAGREPDHGVNAGLFNYPVLMAADILLHRADVVPVGGDNLQHVEVARDIAAAFNAAYGEVFVLPEPVLDERTRAIPGIDGRKMSKSYDNVVPILAEPDEVRRRVMTIVTDSRRPEDAKDPDTCRIFALYRCVAARGDVEEMAARYRAGGVSYKEAKEVLATTLIDRFATARGRYVDIRADRGLLEEILATGAVRARANARPTLDAAREAMGLPT
jgi:tryptophanyl-tRNA synthetase